MIWQTNCHLLSFLLESDVNQNILALGIKNFDEDDMSFDPAKLGPNSTAPTGDSLSTTSDDTEESEDSHSSDEEGDQQRWVRDAMSEVMTFLFDILFLKLISCEYKVSHTDYIESPICSRLAFFFFFTPFNSCQELRANSYVLLQRRRGSRPCFIQEEDPTAGCAESWWRGFTAPFSGIREIWSISPKVHQ